MHGRQIYIYANIDTYSMRGRQIYIYANIDTYGMRDNTKCSVQLPSEGLLRSPIIISGIIYIIIIIIIFERSIF